MVIRVGRALRLNCSNMTSGRISVCLRFFPCVERERKDIAIFFYLADFLISWFFLFFAPAGTITSIAGHFADCRLKGKNQRERERERETNTGFRQRNREQVITQLAMKWWQAFVRSHCVCCSDWLFVVEFSWTFDVVKGFPFPSVSRSLNDLSKRTAKGQQHKV